MATKVITGIGTGIGKTYISAVLCKEEGLDYWKPIQSGDLHTLDSDFVRKHAINATIHKERILLTEPLSPHAAAKIDGVSLGLEDFTLPTFEKDTLIEGAGGLFVPLNETGLCYIDVFKAWNLPMVVVTQNYLGSINHTLLTLNALRQANLTIDCLVINGKSNPASELIYENLFPEIKIIRIPENYLEA